MNRRPHISIDLETLAKWPNAPILSIGAVMFCPHTQQLLKPWFYATCDLGSQSQYTREDPETRTWWGLQDLQARDAAFGGEYSIQAVLKGLQDWWPDRKSICWAQGKEFDFAILRYHLAHWDMSDPWDYQAPACARDMLWTDPREPVQGTAHHALHDAVWAARRIMTRAGGRAMRREFENKGPKHGY